MELKLQSHYSDNQSPTSDNHFFLGGCRRLSEVGKCLSMIADQSAIGCQRITSTTSRRPPTTTFWGGCFSEEFGGRQMIVDDRRPVGDWSAIGCQNSWSVRGFRCSIENLSPTKLLERLQSTGRGSELKWCGHFQHTLFTSDSRDHKLEKTGGVHSLECQPVHACCLCTS